MNQTPANSVYSSSTGTASTNPFVEVFSTRSPTSFDVNYPIQKRWYNTFEELEFLLVGFTSFSGYPQAVWVNINSGGGGGGGITWSVISDPTFQMAVDSGYVTNANVTYTLPLTATLGQIIRVTVRPTFIATINQNAGQQILLGDQTTTLGVGGSLTSTKDGDCVELICTTPGAPTVFTVASSMGNWTTI